MKWAAGTWGWVAVLAAAVLPYLNGLGNSFHYDDEHAVVRNPHLRRLANVPRFFVDSGTFSAEPDMAMYRPLVQASLAANYALAGYDPVGYHVVNVALHALAAAGAFALFGRLLSPSSALVAGLLFAAHPAHSQAVNYVSSRSELMAVAGVLWALYLAWARRRSGRGSLAYGAALLSKSAAVAALPLLALLEGARPAALRRWRGLSAFALLTAGYVVLISWDGFLPRSLAQDVRPWQAQLCTQTKVLSQYLRLAAFPVGLSVEHAVTVSASAWQPAVLAAAALAASLLALALRAWRGAAHAAGLGCLWFFAGLGLTFAVPLNAIVNEHRLYLPLAGLALATAAPLRRLGPGRGATLQVATVLVVVLLVLALTTWQRNRAWESELTLWTAAAQRAPNSFRTWSNLGLAQHAEGRLAAARQAYERALRLNPGSARTWNNYGLLLEETGDAAGAVDAYGRSARAHRAFSGALANLGRVRLEAGDLAGADSAIAAALARNPTDVDALVHAGRLAQRRGDVAAARARYDEALRLDPASGAAANNLGLLLWEQGDAAGARRWLQRSLAAAPAAAGLRQTAPGEAEVNLALLDLAATGLSRAQAYRQLVARFPGRGELALALGQQCARAGDWTEAAQVYEAALARGAVAAGLRAALGDAYQALGRHREALAEYRAAVGQSPADPRLFANLAAAAAAIGRRDEALEATRHALRLDPSDARARANLQRLEAAQPGAGNAGK